MGRHGCPGSGRRLSNSFNYANKNASRLGFISLNSLRRPGAYQNITPLLRGLDLVSEWRRIMQPGHDLQKNNEAVTSPTALLSRSHSF